MVPTMPEVSPARPCALPRSRPGSPRKRKGSGDTLSEHVWRVFHTKKGAKTDGTTGLRRFALLAFVAWLPVGLDPL